MATNRFSNIVTSRYDARSLEEIMAIPLSKQKTHDSLLAAQDQLSLLDSRKLKVDEGSVGKATGAIKDKLSGLSENIMARGVSRDSLNEFRRVKAESDALYGSEGLAGRAEANAIAVQKYLKDVTSEKGRQGWSIAEAQQFAMEKIGLFEGTDAGDGTFNTFSGEQLTEYVDGDEFIRTAMKDIEEQIDAGAMSIIRIGGMPAFTKAFEKRDVSYKDYNRVMSHLSTMAESDSRLQKSLVQAAKFSGEETPLDFGKFEWEDFTNAKGEKDQRRVWKMGKSTFGQKMASIGDAGSYRRIKSTQTLREDKVLYKMWELGKDKQAAQDMIFFDKGELIKVSVEGLKGLKKTQEEYLVAKDDLFTKLQTRKDMLIKDGMNPNDVANEYQYKLIAKNYEDATINYSRSKSRVDDMFEFVDEKLSSEEMQVLEVVDFIDDNGGAMNALRKLSGDSDLSIWVENKLKELRRIPNYSGRSDEEELEILAQNRVAYLMIDDYGDKGLQAGILDMEQSRTTHFEKYIKENPTASYFEILESEGEGKFATTLGRRNKGLTKYFNILSSTLSSGKGKATDSPEIIGLLTEKQPTAESLTYKVSTTGKGGWDRNGDYFNSVLATNDEGKQAFIQVIDNDNMDTLRAAAKDLGLSSSSIQRDKGKQITANINHMRSIKQADITKQAFGGTIILNTKVELDGEPLNVTYTVETIGNDRIYYAHIGEYALNEGNPIQGEAEMALSIDKVVSKLPNK